MVPLPQPGGRANSIGTVAITLPLSNEDFNDYERLVFAIKGADSDLVRDTCYRPEYDHNLL